MLQDLQEFFPAALMEVHAIKLDGLFECVDITLELF